MAKTQIRTGSGSDRARAEASGSQPSTRPLQIGGAVAGAISSVVGVPLTSIHALLLRRLTALSPADAAATIALPALLTALGGALGYATHTRPDLGLGVMMATGAAGAALLRGLAPPRAPRLNSPAANASWDVALRLHFSSSRKPKT